MHLIDSLIYLIVLNLLTSSINSVNVCDRNLDIESKLPQELVSINTKLETGIKEFKPVNSTSLNECVLKCCSRDDCNFIFYKESQYCFLITCIDDSCTPVPNPHKSNLDPIDYIVKVRGHLEQDDIQFSGVIQQVIDKDKNELADYLENINHNKDKDESTKCLNENFFKLDGICREFLPNTPACMFYLDECNSNLNEECLAKNARSKHGTCQCKIGFRRNLNTFVCDIPIMDENLKLLSLTTKQNNRRRPAPSSSSLSSSDLTNKQELGNTNESEESFWQKILQEIGIRQNHHLKNSSTTTKTTSTTTTITTTSTTTTTDPPKIFTNDLQAYAGPDIHVYYPSRMCILNGTLTSFMSGNSNRQITRWEWTKDESSPAFGNFARSNESPVALYENLVDGEYKFVLKVWTNDGQFSQDFVHVYVHSTFNSNYKTNKIRTSNIELENVENLNENIIEIELDIKPSLFSEYLKEQFLTKLEIFLIQNDVEFKLKEPKCILLNTRVNYDSKGRSNVILELIITDKSNQNLNNTIKSDQIDENREIVKSINLIKLMRKKQKTFKTLLDSVNTFIERFQKRPNMSTLVENKSTKKKSVLDFLNIKIKSISQLTCNDDLLFINTDSIIKYNCSNHGKCDLNSHKCICDKYWMPNLYLYYIDYESDITNGNNCEWNIPLVITLSLFLTFCVYVIIKVLFKYILYYLLCCCCCFGRKHRHGKDYLNDKANNKKYVRGLIRDDSYMNDDDDDDEDDEKYTISKAKRSLFNKLRNVPGTNNKQQKQAHKYALLQNEENESLNSSSKSSRTGFFKKNGLDEQMGTHLNFDDDEDDVVYDENITRINKSNNKINGNSNSNEMNIKKYNLI